MTVRRRRKGQPTVNVMSFDIGSLQEIEMHLRDAERQETAQRRFSERHHLARANSPSLSETVSAAVQSMRIADG